MYNLNNTHGYVYPFTIGGYGANELSAFDDAEVNAGITALNAVRLTSFVPVGPKGRWEITDKKPSIENGSALYMPYADAYSDNKMVSAVIAIGLNTQEDKPGIIMEYAGAEPVSELVRIARRDVKRAFKRRISEGWDLGEMLVREIEVTQKENIYACALAGALFIPEALYNI